MSFKKRLPPVGSRPGTLAIPPDSPEPKIHLFDYEGDVCVELEIEDIEDLAPYVESERVTWVDVRGFGDEAKLRRIAELFGLDRLALADVTNVPQRAKSDIHPDYQLIIARAPDPNVEDRVETPQVAILIGRHFVLTFQDRYFGFFEPLRERIRDGRGQIRRHGPDYLGWALLDVLIDHYFPVLMRLSDELEALEDEVDGEPSHEVLEDLHRMRRALVVVRRVGWPQRDTLRTLAESTSPFIGAPTLEYMRSTEQNMAQCMEAIDAARETTSGLIDLYLSNVSHRTNEIMKMLTLMASIFIPLTFIAGIYGMNFENMPELHSRIGYYAVLLAMVVLGGGMVAYFRRRNWIGSPPPRRPRRGQPGFEESNH